VQEFAHKQIARVSPIQQPVPEFTDPRPNSNISPRNSPTQEVPVIDLSDEDTIAYNEYFDPYDPVEEPILEPPQLQRILNHEPPEIIDLRSHSPTYYVNPIATNGIRSEDEPPEVIDLEPELEPLDPDAEYYQNIHRMFVTLDEYARNVYLNIHAP